MSKIIFCHIPKNGGSTFRATLIESFGTDKNFHFNANRLVDEIKRFERLRDEKKLKYDVYQGHIGYGLDLKIPENERVIWITFLRNPVERVISYWNYFKSLPGFRAECFIGIEERYCREIEKIRNSSLDEFIQGEYCWEVSNGQIRHLASDNGFPLTFNSCPTIGPAEFEKAKARLRDNFIFGLVEDYNRSLTYIYSRLLKMGYKLCIDYGRCINRGSLKTSLSTESISLIEERNKFDIQLYKYAEKLFKKNNAHELTKDQISQVSSDKKDELHTKEKARNVLKKIPNRNKIGIYGSGLHTHYLLSLLEEENIVIDNIYDSYKNSGSLNGIEIKNVNRILSDQLDTVIISSHIFQKDMIEKLEEIRFAGEIISFYDMNDSVDIFS